MCDFMLVRGTELLLFFFLLFRQFHDFKSRSKIMIVQRLEVFLFLFYFLRGRWGGGGGGGGGKRKKEVVHLSHTLIKNKKIKNKKDHVDLRVKQAPQVVPISEVRKY